MTRRGKFVKPAALRYLAYKERIGWEARASGITVPLDGRLYLRVWIYVGRRGREDWDNWAKAVADGLVCVAMHDDNQIDQGIVRVYAGQPDERVDVEIGVLAVDATDRGRQT
jgi:crossover junction endodeoxyribonuclease RusA